MVALDLMHVLHAQWRSSAMKSCNNIRQGACAECGDCESTVCFLRPDSATLGDTGACQNVVCPENEDLARRPREPSQAPANLAAANAAASY